ncbi:MAG: PAS domain S-box protein [Sphingobacteriales bacterium]|nr:PAS domain S-box protein [Sphingobacteriales bacterium]
MKNYKKQISVFLYVSLAIVLGSFSVIFFNFRKQVKLQNEILKIEANLIQADSLSNNLLQIESDKRGFQLTSDVNYLKNFYNIKRNCNSNIFNMKKNVVAGTDTTIFQRLDSLLKLRIANLDSGIVVFTTQGFQAAIDFMQLKGKKSIRESLNNNLDALKGGFLAKLNKNTAEINVRSNHNLTGLLILISIFVLLMFTAVRTFRRAQKKIIRNHKRFQEAQRIAKIGSWEWDIAANKITWSQEQFRLFGEERNSFEVTYDGYLSHFSPAEKERTKKLINDAFAGKSNYAVEHEIIRKNGTKIMVFEQGTVLFDENRRPVSMFGTTQDITEQKKTEQELKLTQQKFQAIFDNTADGIYQSTVDGRFIMANPAMAKIFGYSSPNELIKSVTDIGAQIYADSAYRQRMAELLAQYDHVENFEAPLVTKQGSIIWVSESTRVVRNGAGAIKYFEGTIRDITKRKKAEKEVTDLMFALNQSSIVDISDGEGNIQFVNENFTRISGYSMDEIKGLNHRVLKSGYHTKEHYQNLWSTVLSGKVWRCEVLNKAKHDSLFWTDTTIVPLMGDYGKPSQFITIRSDITEKKNAEKDLMNTKQKFQAIFDNTADGIYQSTIDGKFIMVNPSMARIFGYDSPEEMVHLVTNIGEQLYADPAERKKMVGIILAEGHIENFELQVAKKGGEIIWVSANIRIVRDEKGEINYFEGVLEDITDKKRAEEQLKNLSGRLQLALKATSVGIWDWDIINNNTIWDDEMFKMYDVDKNNYTTITGEWESAVHPDDLNRVNEELAAAMNGEREFDSEFRVIWKDKSIHYIRGHALVQRDESGNPVRMIGTNEDITQRKLAEEEILQLNRNLDQFANITAHDLQEPIRMVSGFLGLLDKKYTDVIDEQGKSYIYRAKDGADRMSILIRDLLEYSRSGNKAAKKEPVNLNQVMDLVNKDMSIVMTDTSAKLHVPPSLPTVTGTQSALYRLFLNLISNGIKFRKKDTAPEVWLTAKENHDCWEFTLQDNGIGVKEEDQPKLFNAFQRLHRRDEYPGTGLGLVTCKKIVEVHGGRIWMTSEYGKGTAFHFTLPKLLMSQAA